MTVLETQPNKKRGLGALVLGLVLALLLIAGSAWGVVLCYGHWTQSDSVKRVDPATIAPDARLQGHFVAMEGGLLMGRRVAVFQRPQSPYRYTVYFCALVPPGSPPALPRVVVKIRRSDYDYAFQGRRRVWVQGRLSHPVPASVVQALERKGVKLSPGAWLLAEDTIAPGFLGRQLWMLGAVGAALLALLGMVLVWLAIKPRFQPFLGAPG